MAGLTAIGEGLTRRVGLLENSPPPQAIFPADPASRGLATSAPTYTMEGEALLHNRVERLLQRVAELSGERPTTFPLPSL